MEGVARAALYRWRVCGQNRPKFLFDGSVGQLLLTRLQLADREQEQERLVGRPAVAVPVLVQMPDALKVVPMCIHWWS